MYSYTQIHTCIGGLSNTSTLLFPGTIRAPVPSRRRSGSFGPKKHSGSMKTLVQLPTGRELAAGKTDSEERRVLVPMRRVIRLRPNLLLFIFLFLFLFLFL